MKLYFFIELYGGLNYIDYKTVAFNDKDYKNCISLWWHLATVYGNTIWDNVNEPSCAQVKSKPKAWKTTVAQ